MRIIPVIDILNGGVVNAVKGNRKQYQPLKSKLCASSCPIDVALAFEECGFTELYIADLDAIMGKGDNIVALGEIREKTRLQLMVDSGTRNLDQIRKLIEHKISKVIIGTETLTDLYFVRTAVERFGDERIIVSLDLKDRKVLSNSRKIQAKAPIELACELQDMGVSEILVLDLARVGSGEGIDFDLLRVMLSKLRVKVLVGGGVRDIDDLSTLKTMSVHGVLLASSLHSGRVSMEIIRQFNLFA